MRPTAPPKNFCRLSFRYVMPIWLPGGIGWTAKWERTTDNEDLPPKISAWSGSEPPDGRHSEPGNPGNGKVAVRVAPRLRHHRFSCPAGRWSGDAWAGDTWR